MKRLASWIRSIADEIDPPPKRGRPSKRAERNAAAVDSLFEQSGRSYEIGSGEPWPPTGQIGHDGGGFLA